MSALGCTDSNSYGITSIFGMVGTHGHGIQSRRGREMKLKSRSELVRLEANW